MELEFCECEVEFPDDVVLVHFGAFLIFLLRY